MRVYYVAIGGDRFVAVRASSPGRAYAMTRDGVRRWTLAYRLGFALGRRRSR